MVIGQLNWTTRMYDKYIYKEQYKYTREDLLRDKKKVSTARRWDEYSMSAGAKTCPAVGSRSPILAQFSADFVIMSKAPQIKSLTLEHCSVPSDVAKGQTTHAYHDQADVQMTIGSHAPC